MRIYSALACVLFVATPAAAEPQLLIEFRYEASWETGESPLLMEFLVWRGESRVNPVGLSGFYTRADVGRTIFAPPADVESMQALFSEPTNWFGINPDNFYRNWRVPVDGFWSDAWYTFPGFDYGLEVDRFAQPIGHGLYGYDLTDVSQTITDIQFTRTGYHVFAFAAQTIRLYGEALPPPPVYPPLAGDYNENGTVDAADYVVWRELMSRPEGSRPDLPNALAGPRPPTDGDYLSWRYYFGQTVPPIGAAAVPEPSTWLLSLFVLCFAGRGGRRRDVR